MKFKLPDLPYSSDALEPYIDSQTMLLHHDKHHRAYVDKLNEVLTRYPELNFSDVDDLLQNLDRIPPDIRTAAINHGGGHANHSLFWTIMAPAGSEKPSGNFLKALESVFGSFSDFQNQFQKTALAHFGSGWAWLVIDQDKKLNLYSLPNQDSPLSKGETPILTLDLWEHAYYLKYQNRRPEYVQNWWNVVNWNEIEKRYSHLAP